MTRTFYELRAVDKWGGYHILWEETSLKVARIRFNARRKYDPDCRLVKVTETTIPHRPNK